jgi:hypothetical protein
MNRGVDALVVAGAAGAAVHAVLAPEHVREVAAAVAAVLAVFVAGYVTTRLAAVPPLDPEREPFDLLGVCTTAIEALGLAVAFPRMLTRGGRSR